MTFHTKLFKVKNHCVRFDKVDGLIKIYDGTKYLVLFDPERYDAIYNDAIHFARIRIDSLILYL